MLLNFKGARKMKLCTGVLLCQIDHLKMEQLDLKKFSQDFFIAENLLNMIEILAFNHKIGSKIERQHCFIPKLLILLLVNVGKYAFFI